MIEIKITDAGVSELFNRLIGFGGNPRIALKGIGEEVETFTKRLFDKSADPYGAPWAKNSDAVLNAVLSRSVKNFTKKGGLSKKGKDVLAGKKPLIGETNTLSKIFHLSVVGNSVTVSSIAAYAATQQFGAKKGAYGKDKRNRPIPWGNIPARPFFPNSEQGLPDELGHQIDDVLRAAIANAAKG